MTAEKKESKKPATKTASKKTAEKKAPAAKTAKKPVSTAVHAHPHSHDHAHDAKDASHGHAPRAEAKKTPVKSKDVQVVAKKRLPAYPAPIKQTAPENVERIREKRKKLRLPLFRGRFGKRGGVRKISKAKWQKWRYPRGIDIWHHREDGALPQSGYRTPTELRDRHPSGYRLVHVRNVQDVSNIREPEFAIVIAHEVGRRKRIAIINEADARKIPVLNR